MADKKSKEDATKRQGEAQVDFGPDAPDENMQTEGQIARNNPAASAKEAQDRERNK